MKQYLFIFYLLFITSCEKNKSLGTKIIPNDSISIVIKSYNNPIITSKKRLYYSRKYFDIISRLENNQRNRDTLFKIVFNIYKLKEWNSFDIKSKELLKISLKESDSTNIVNSYRYRANFFKNTNVFDSAFYYYVKAEKIYKKLGDSENFANIQFNKSIVQYEINDFLGADLSLTKALQSVKKNDKRKLFEILSEISVVSIGLKNYQKALDFQNQALTLAEKNNFDDIEQIKLVSFNNLGFILQNQNENKKAVQFYKMALLNKKIKKDPFLDSNLIDNLGYSELQLKNFKNIPELFYKSLKIRDSLNITTYRVLSNIHLSEYYDEINDSKKSINFAYEALEIAKKSEIPIDIVAALKQVAAVDKLNASSYTNEYILINDSLQVAERKNIDRFARIQLETDEVMKENKALGDKNQNLVYYLLGTILLFSVGFFMYSEKQKQKIFVLKQEQQASNQQIFNLLISQQENTVNIRIEEQKRIAKELHDGVLGRLFGTRLFIDSVNKSNSKEAIEGRSAAIVEMQSIEQQIREISHDMNSEKGKIINNFVGIVIDLLENQKKAYPSELHYSFGVDITWEKLDNFAKINLYRILQESLQNSNKYANAKSIEVLFKEIDEKIVLTITDNGKGFDVNKGKKGIGMSNMKERAEESGGIYEVVSAKNAGTTTTVTLPTNLKQQTTS